MNCVDWKGQIEVLEAQLAAEQENTRQVQIYIDGLQAGADSLRAELAAEKEKLAAAHEQLAAERVKAKNALRA